MTQTMNTNRLVMKNNKHVTPTCHTDDMKWKSAIVNHKLATQHGISIDNQGTKRFQPR